MRRLNHRDIDNGNVQVYPSEFPVEYNPQSVIYIDTTHIKSIDDDKFDHLLGLFHSEHDDDILNIGLQMLQDWLMVATPSKIYTISTVLFHKYGRENVAVTNCMSHFSMFFLTKATVKLTNGKT